MNGWEKVGLVSLYDKKGRGRIPKLNNEQEERVKELTKTFPKNINRICALVKEEFGISVSKWTIKRILKTLKFSWHRIRKKVKGKPDPLE
ncbi:MAG: helix-turn-helix domain-containing protein [Nitrospirae bacterium]|nr:helix-turn-helix domain-containing protein [Nitrospirota bacterium]